MRGTLRKQFKVCLIGDGYVGKTSIRQKYLGHGFKASYIPTLGVDFAQKTIETDDVQTTLVIWDIAGQPLFQSLRRRYYDGSSGIILVYSVVDRATFDNASKWLVEAYGFMGQLPPMVIVGNKIDLRETRPNEETISPEEGQEFAKRFSQKMNTPSIFIETSALTGENIEDAFSKLIQLMIQKAGLTPVTRSSEIGQVQVQPEEPQPRETTAFSRSPPESSAPIIETKQEASSISESDLDPVTSLSADSPYLKEQEIGQAMTTLVNLRTEMNRAEEELAQVTSQLETKLLNLRNTVHIKKIMYDHLQTQLRTTRQEWADAYNEYMKLKEQKEREISKRSREIESIRERINETGKSIRRRVDALDLKKMTQSHDD